MGRFEVMRQNEAGVLIHICYRDTLAGAIDRAQVVANKRAEVIDIYSGEEWIQSVHPDTE